MTYSIKEVFFTLQGEGGNAGRAAVFCRFAGCNLWNGRESDRANAACSFCDTDFLGTNGAGGGKFANASVLADAIARAWPTGADNRFVVCTGGEPLLQLDANLVRELHERQFVVAVETNGTLDAPPGIDWICVSPKAGTVIRLIEGQEVKVVFPQVDLDPASFEALNFDRFYLQPMDGPARKANTQLAVDYCLSHPRWRLSLQTHKLLGIP